MDEISKLFGGAEQLFQNIRNNASKVGRDATRMMLELYHVVKSSQTPFLDKTIIIVALGYQLLPNDLFRQTPLQYADRKDLYALCKDTLQYDGAELWMHHAFYQ